MANAVQSTSGRTSGTDSSLHLTLHADPVSKKVVKSDQQAVSDLRRLSLEDIVTKCWFQDNSMLFNSLLLEDKSPLVACVFPPGSGKSTNAQLFRHYISLNLQHEERRTNVEKFLDDCEFQKYEHNLQNNHKLFRNSSYVFYIDFEEVYGHECPLQEAYATQMKTSWRLSGLPKDIWKVEIKRLEENSNNVWASFSRLRTEFETFCDENVYVILDSVDSMFNLIANLEDGKKRAELYQNFKNEVLKLVNKNRPQIRLFCFGVSPFILPELISCQTRYSCYEIASPRNVGQYFSFSETTIEKLIKDWSLCVSLNDCKNVAMFQYNSNLFINPYICVSYLESLKNGTAFGISFSPRSLWMKRIFEPDDLERLISRLALSKGFTKAFQMKVSMKNILYSLTHTDSAKNRSLCYPLFVYSGFLSCRKIEASRYALLPANDSMRLVLHYHLSELYLKEFKVSPLENRSMVKQFLRGEFTAVCDILSAALFSADNAKLFGDMNDMNKKCNLFVAGMFHALTEYNYELHHVKSDSVFVSNEDRLIIMKYKYIKLYEEEASQPPIKKARQSEGKNEEVLVTECIKVITKMRDNQLPKYAQIIFTTYKKDAEIYLFLFHENRVILLSCAYSFPDCTYFNFNVTASKRCYLSDDKIGLIKTHWK